VYYIQENVVGVGLWLEGGSEVLVLKVLHKYRKTFLEEL
jgi:hypothetical protein